MLNINFNIYAKSEIVLSYDKHKKLGMEFVVTLLKYFPWKKEEKLFMLYTFSDYSRVSVDIIFMKHVNIKFTRLFPE